MKQKFVIMGLDCAAPELVFDKLVDRVPNIARLAEEAASGLLESTDPPITIPAWMSMMTGMDPGQLGLYGFRHRRNFDYRDFWIASSKSIRRKPIWDFVGEAGGKSCIVGIPPTYPPLEISGQMISCFITPDTSLQYTYPPELKREVEDLVGEYIPDVAFRVEDRSSLLGAIYDMTDKRFTVIEYLLQEKPWNLFAFVEIGLDRIHHAFWKYYDSKHYLYSAGNEFESVIPDYYAHLDKWIGRLQESIPRDVPIMVVSDHGAKAMKGAFCINQWLSDEGYLSLERPAQPVSLSKVRVDWCRTRAWGWGGYYARIFLNLEGREPGGIVQADDYEVVREELARRISSIRGPQGQKWSTRIIFPEERYNPLEGDPPDLMIYLDDLSWRSAGTVGHGETYLPENDTGPDDAVHAKDGIFIYKSGGIRPGFGRASILDVAPTVLKSMGLSVPTNMRGNPIGV
jgi:predicted AlkP superfamily phosphohydrolase/phosphomutase